MRFLVFCKERPTCEAIFSSPTSEGSQKVSGQIKLSLPASPKEAEVFFVTTRHYEIIFDTMLGQDDSYQSSGVVAEP